jgi:hypothetical protein
MLSLAELVRKHSEFAVPTQYCVGGEFGESVVCFHNFYAEIFRNADTPVTLYLCYFDSAGAQRAAIARDLASGEATQIASSEAGFTDSGLVTVVAIPRFDLQALAKNKIKLRGDIGTGFYMIWRDAAGHVDTMHEWLPVRREGSVEGRYYFVLNPPFSQITCYGLVLMNPTLDASAHVEASVRVYTAQRKVLGTAVLPTVPPMGSSLIYFNDVFPQIGAWAESHGALGVELLGKNVIEPLTVEIHRSGDFHLHHIN